MLRDPLFASVNEHLGHELSRRDDLESLAYLAHYMFHGVLPWMEEQNVDNPEENYPLIALKKHKITPESLFGGLPRKFPQD